MRIFGTIVNEKNEPLPGAQFKIVDLSTGATLTDWIVSTNGTYYIDTPDVIGDNDAALFKATGYTDFMYFIKDRINTNGNVVMSKGNNIIPLLLLVAIVAVIGRKNVVGNPAAAAVVMKNLNLQKVSPTVKIVAGGVLLFFIYKTLVWFGVLRGGDTISLDNASTNPNSFWSPNFYKTKPDYVQWTAPITYNQAVYLARQIYDAFGWINDNEEQAIAVFKSFRAQSSVSYLADVFAQQYGQDLLTFLRGGNWPQDRLSDADVQNINAYVSRLPKY